MISGQARTSPNYSTDVVNETSQKPALRGEILTGLGAESPTKPYCCLKKSNSLRKDYVKELRSKSESRPLSCNSFLLHSECLYMP
jgi:hypothetical protein